MIGATIGKDIQLPNPGCEYVKHELDDSILTVYHTQKEGLQPQVMKDVTIQLPNTDPYHNISEVRYEVFPDIEGLNNSNSDSTKSKSGHITIDLLVKSSLLIPVVLTAACAGTAAKNAVEYFQTYQPNDLKDVAFGLGFTALFGGLTYHINKKINQK